MSQITQWDTGLDSASGPDFEIRPLSPDDKPWVQRVLKQHWASTKQVSRGRVLNADDLPGFAAWKSGNPIGLITYHIDAHGCEIVTHNALAGHGGVGSVLLAEVRRVARDKGCSRLWCVTTNDNTAALRFYQRRDFDICALHRDALAAVRTLKPEMPEVGLDGIRVRHEIELEYPL